MTQNELHSDSCSSDAYVSHACALRLDQALLTSRGSRQARASGERTLSLAAGRPSPGPGVERPPPSPQATPQASPRARPLVRPYPTLFLP